MTDYPKCIYAKVFSNSLLQISFENGEVRMLHTHFIGAMKQRRLLFGTFPINNFRNKIEIKEDGTLILNDLDVYSPEELWLNSERVLGKSSSNTRGGAQMRSKLGNTMVEVWEISKEIPDINWIKEAFSRKQIWWETKTSDQTQYLVVVIGGGVGYGYVGDYLICMPDRNFQVFSKKQASNTLNFETPSHSESNGNLSEIKTKLSVFDNLDNLPTKSLDLAREKYLAIPKVRNSKLSKGILGFDAIDFWRINWEEEALGWLSEAFEKRQLWLQLINDELFLRANRGGLGREGDYLIRLKEGWRILSPSDFSKEIKAR